MPLSSPVCFNSYPGAHRWCSLGSRIYGESLFPSFPTQIHDSFDFPSFLSGWGPRPHAPLPTSRALYCLLHLCLAKRGWFILSFLHTASTPFEAHPLKPLFNIENWTFPFLSLNWTFCGSVILFIPFCLELINRRLFFPALFWKGCLMT